MDLQCRIDDSVDLVEEVAEVYRVVLSRDRFREDRSRSRDRVDPVSLFESPVSTLLRGSLRWDFACIETASDKRYRDVGTPTR